MILRKFMVVGLVGTMLGGCATNSLNGQGATLGTLAGAVGGAAIGSAFGQGSGKVAAIAAGALLGGFLGNQIGAQLDPQDRQYYTQAQYSALEQGGTTNWNNPNTGVYGSSYAGPTYSVNSRRCREYTTTIYIDGRPQVERGQACRNADGTWSRVG